MDTQLIKYLLSLLSILIHLRLLPSCSNVVLYSYVFLGWYVVTLQVHGQKAVWEDPVEWVRGTLPWPSAQQDQAKLFHLPPPSIGSSSPCQPSEERPHKETPSSSMESDPLVGETVIITFLVEFLITFQTEMGSDFSTLPSFL